MKKGYKHNELSDRVCEAKGCNKRLKKRRVEEHNDSLCFDCNQRANGRGKYNANKKKL
jgi:hypothetical protein